MQVLWWTRRALNGVTDLDAKEMVQHVSEFGYAYLSSEAPRGR